jgi:hypothetical protein
MRVLRLFMFVVLAVAIALTGKFWLGGGAAADTRYYRIPGDVNGDGDFNIADPIYMLSCLFADEQCPDGPAVCTGGPYVFEGGILQTGQTHVWTPLPPFALMDPPPPPGGPFFGQDGSYRAGVPHAFDFIPGNDWDDSTWIVVDMSAGLMWQCANWVGRMPFHVAIDYCENLALGSFTDWRLPSIRELQSLVDYGKTAPAVDEEFFDCQPDGYWSSTSLEADPGQAWVVHFQDGMSTLALKTPDFQFYVRAVRSMP